MYGTLEYSAHPLHQPVDPRKTNSYLFILADACLVTSVRDGMNLVSHEYVAAQESLDQEDSIIEETPPSLELRPPNDDDVLQPFVKEGPAR